jgi:hypothetical protein
MRSWMIPALVAGVVTAFPVAASADLSLTIVDGYVTIDAKDATVRQILAEWARVGQMKVVNGERITGGPVTLLLTHVPEAQALEILLRSVSGYVAAPRPAPVANASTFDRLLVMPTSTPPRVTTPAPAAAQPFQPPVQPVEMEIEEPGGQPIQVPGPRGPIFPQNPGVPTAPNQRGPVFQPPQAPANGFPPQTGFPPPQPGMPPTMTYPQAVPPAGNPGTIVSPGAMPVGVARPGMLVQPPAQPGQVDPAVETPR